MWKICPKDEVLFYFLDLTEIVGSWYSNLGNSQGLDPRLKGEGKYLKSKQTAKNMSSTHGEEDHMGFWGHEGRRDSCNSPPEHKSLGNREVEFGCCSCRNLGTTTSPRSSYLHPMFALNDEILIFDVYFHFFLTEAWEINPPGRAIRMRKDSAVSLKSNGGL